MPNGKVKFYLYTEAMIDESDVPIQDPLKTIEAEDVYQAAQAYIKELPADAHPKLEDYSMKESWAHVSISIGNGIEIMEICNIDYEDLTSLQ